VDFARNRFYARLKNGGSFIVDAVRTVVGKRGGGQANVAIIERI
jgi:hypothetical protein